MKDCTEPDNYCIAALQQKQVQDVVGENLRTEPARVFTFLFRLQFGYDRSGVFISKPKHWIQKQTNWTDITLYFLPAIKDDVMVGMINGITNTMSPVPGLSQDDSDVAYCNADHLPERCKNEVICHCPHLVELELCEVYEFIIRDNRSKKMQFGHWILNIENVYCGNFQVCPVQWVIQYISMGTDFK